MSFGKDVFKMSFRLTCCLDISRSS